MGDSSRSKLEGVCWKVSRGRGDRFTHFHEIFINSSIQRQKILITISITLIFLPIEVEISKLVEIMNLFILLVFTIDLILKVNVYDDLQNHQNQILNFYYFLWIRFLG